MTLGQFSEIFFMLALPFSPNALALKGIVAWSYYCGDPLRIFFVYGGAEEYFTYALLFLGILLHGVSYDFYYVTAYIYVDKSAGPHAHCSARAYHPLLSGVRQPARLPSGRRNDGKNVCLSGTG